MHAAGSRGFAMGASNNGYARFGGNAYADEQAREERRTFRCAGCMLVAGFVLIVAGLSVMYGADYGATKARVVDGYDEIVDAWTNTYSEPFAATTFEVVFGDSATHSAVPAHATHHVTPIDHASGRVHDYYPTAFEVTSLLEQVAVPGMRANATMGLPADGWGDASTGAAAEPATPALTPDQERDVFEYLTVPREVVVRVTNPANDANASPGDGTSGGATPTASSGEEDAAESVSLGARALVAKFERRSTGWKPCKYQHGGYYRAGMCTTYTVLDTLCVKVSRDPGSGRWAANATYGGVGCDPAREWRVESRKMTRAPVGGADPSLSTIRHLGSGRVVVRSAHDPLMAALNVTEGSMFFAEKQAGQAAAATVLLVVGIAASVPGVLLSAPFLTRAWRGREVLRRARGERRDKGREAFDDVL